MNPLCKVCGKPVPKSLGWFHVIPASANRRENGDREGHTIYLDRGSRPKSAADAQRLVNQSIVGRPRMDGGEVIAFSTWDGESYEWGGHFHAQSCAAAFGKSMAEKFPDYSMQAYKDAMIERGLKEGNACPAS